MCCIVSHVCIISLHMHTLSTCIALSPYTCIVFPLMYPLPTQHIIFHTCIISPYIVAFPYTCIIFPNIVSFPYTCIISLLISIPHTTFKLDSTVLCSLFGSVVASVNLADKSDFAYQGRASRVKYLQQHRGNWNALQLGQT